MVYLKYFYTLESITVRLSIKNPFFICFMAIACSACNSKSELIKPEGEWRQINERIGIGEAKISIQTTATAEATNGKK